MGFLRWLGLGPMASFHLVVGPQRVHGHASYVNTEITHMSTIRRPRGRPSKQIKDRLFQMRVSEQFLRTIDEWRREQSDLPPRAEAVRRMVEIVAKSRKKQDS